MCSVSVSVAPPAATTSRWCPSRGLTAWPAAPRRRGSRGPACLLQTELLARREQCNRFADAPRASLRTFCDVDPDDKVAALGSRQLLKEAPRFQIGFDRLRDVTRQLGNLGLRRVLVRGGSRSQAGRLEQPSAVQFHPAPAIDVRPFAGRFARRHLDRKAIVVESLHQAVDPAEAERFANEVLVRQRFHARVGLVKYEPNSATRFVVPCEPRAPFGARSHVEQRQLCHVRHRPARTERGYASRLLRGPWW